MVHSGLISTAGLGRVFHRKIDKKALGELAGELALGVALGDFFDEFARGFP